MPLLIVSVVTDSLGFITILFTFFSNLINMAIGNVVGLISMLCMVILSDTAVTSCLPPSERVATLMRKEVGIKKPREKDSGQGSCVWFWALALADLCCIPIFLD